MLSSAVANAPEGYTQFLHKSKMQQKLLHFGTISDTDALPLLLDIIDPEL